MTAGSPVMETLRSYLLERAQPLVLSLDKEGRALRVDGNPGHYGLDEGATAELVELADNLLLGLPREEPQFWPLVEVAGRQVTVWWVPEERQDSLLLADTHDAGRELRERQQAANELALAGIEKSRTIRELKQARADLEAKTRALEEARAFQNRLMTTLSHDLRTPLTSILGYARLMEPHLPASIPIQRALGAIERNALFVKALAENLLELGSAASGEWTLLVEPSDLSLLAEEIDEMMRPLAAGKGLELAVHSHLPPMARPSFDAIKLRQILINLLSNAIRYTREGRVAADLAFASDVLTLTVSDTGIGIDPQYQDKVFEPLNRGAQQGREGAGLGLSIVRQLVQRMGGEITLRSAPGVGTVISVRIPEGAAPTSADGRPSEIEVPRVQLANRRVLVVDDDPDICQLLLWSLGEIGYQASALADADRAVAVVREEQPGMVILDVDLGTRSGIALAQELRLAHYAGTIVVFSGAVGGSVRQAARRAGADAFLPKPLDLKRIITWLRTQLPGKE